MLDTRRRAVQVHFTLTTGSWAPPWPRGKPPATSMMTQLAATSYMVPLPSVVQQWVCSHNPGGYSQRLFVWMTSRHMALMAERTPPSPSDGLFSTKPDFQFDVLSTSIFSKLRASPPPRIWTLFLGDKCMPSESYDPVDIINQTDIFNFEQGSSSTSTYLVR